MRKIIISIILISGLSSFSQNQMIIDELKAYPHVCFHIFGSTNPNFEMDTTYWVKNNLISTFKVDSTYFKVAFNLGKDTMTYSMIHFCSYINDSAWIDPFKITNDNRICGCEYSWHSTVAPSSFQNHFIHFKLK